MRYVLNVFNKENPRGKKDELTFSNSRRAINDAKRYTRSGVAFKVEVWPINDHGDVATIAPVNVQFGAVADGLREHVIEMTPLMIAMERR